MHKSDEEMQARRREARERGENLRAGLIAMLREGPKTAAELIPREPGDVSPSEVAFQLERLAEDGRVVGAEDGPYRLGSQGSQGRAKRS
ncbi:MAG: hypothetical protein QOE75_1810 [Solirubrobacterales bacterium]|nr:hypothetical protein [Solirubrobacterales bacterium]